MKELDLKEINEVTGGCYCVCSKPGLTFPWGDVPNNTLCKAYCADWPKSTCT